ncbi:hypothetical protein NBRC116601_10510 [Cognatishimia sp. WU-CL00825]
MAAGSAMAIQPGQRLCAPIKGTIVCTIAMQAARIRAKWPSSVIMLWIYACATDKPIQIDVQMRCDVSRDALFLALFGAPIF